MVAAIAIIIIIYITIMIVNDYIILSLSQIIDSWLVTNLANTYLSPSMC